MKVRGVVCVYCSAFHRDIVVQFVAMGQQINFKFSGQRAYFPHVQKSCNNNLKHVIKSHLM